MPMISISTNRRAFLIAFSGLGVLAGCSSESAATSGAASAGSGGAAAGSTSAMGPSTVASTGSATSTTGSAGVGGTSGAGSSTTSSTTSGSGGHVVGACDNLAAPGVWEEVSPIPGEVTVQGESGKWGAASVVVHPNVSGTIYAGVGFGGVWKSTDCGSTWVKTNTGAHAAEVDSGVQFSLLVWTKDGVDSLAGDNFRSNLLPFIKSANGGTDWDAMYDANSNVAKSVEYGGYGNAITADPNDPNHMLATFHANCSTPNGGCLGETKDGGATWTLAKGPFDGWQEQGVAFIVENNVWLTAATTAPLYRSADQGATWEKVGPGGTSLYRAKGHYYIASAYGMLESADAHTWNGIPNSPQGYAIVGTGKTMYTGYIYNKGQDQIWSASESDPTKWSVVPTPAGFGDNGGPWTMAYDADHKIVYSANHRGGLWRMVEP